MSTAPLIATLTVNGQQLTFWESVIVSREINTLPATYATFEVAEQPGSQLTAGPNGWHVGPGDAATVTLAGQPVLNNAIVDMRQTYYDAGVHHVQIRVYSITQNVVVSTVKGAPGQYLNSNFMQIAGAAAQQVGINVKLIGSPRAADKPFKRISETIGMTIFDFVSGLAAMRDLHMTDDADGNWVFFRGGNGAGGGGLILQEGVNILKARGILEDNQLVPKVDALTQDHGDAAWQAGQISVKASAQSKTALSGLSAQRSQTIATGITEDSQGAQMFANHQVALNELTSCEIVVTMPGWFAPDGQLWITKVSSAAQTVTLNSPMIWPTTFGRSQTLFLKSVRHKQNSSEGSVTELGLCNQAGLGGSNVVDTNPAAPSPPTLGNVNPAAPQTAPGVTPTNPIGVLGGPVTPSGT